MAPANEGALAPVACLPLVQPQPGFICGSLPVPTDVGPYTSELAITPSASAKVVHARGSYPQYRLLPLELDLNEPPPNWLQCEELMHLDPSIGSTSLQGLTECCDDCGGGILTRPLPKKYEALAVNGLAGFGDEVDFIAPAEVMKQLFKTPYSKARLSVAVHRVGRTLILNQGPASGGLRKKSQSKVLEKALFSKFVHHSVNTGTSDSRPTSPSASPSTDPSTPSSSPAFHNFIVQDLDNDNKIPLTPPQIPKKSKKKRSILLKKYPLESWFPVEERPDEPAEESAESGESDSDHEAKAREGFLRVLYWRFRGLKMMLGSDLMLFSNEQHRAVSLHLMEVGRQLSPLVWLDAWLDAVMASVPELAICYHRKGVVEGYELLKTDDVFLLKGVSADGTSAFNPHVVQRNANAILEFLQQNCKQDPGAYWLFKNSGEDLMQLFDLSTLHESEPKEADEESTRALPSQKNTTKSKYGTALAHVCYRLALRLSRSKEPMDRKKCARLFAKCLELLDDDGSARVLAGAHEHVAKLCLSYNQETLPSILEPLLLEGPSSPKALPSTEPLKPPETATDPSQETNSLEVPELSEKAADLSPQPKPLEADGSKRLKVPEVDDSKALVVRTPLELALRTKPKPTSSLTSAEAHLAAVHHLSEAIKAMKRESEQVSGPCSKHPKIDPPPPHRQVTKTNPPSALCQCKKALERPILDARKAQKAEIRLRRLLGLLGKSYLALGKAYKGQNKLGVALKCAELASVVCGRVQATGVSRGWINEASFWGELWMFVGEIYAELVKSCGEFEERRTELVQEGPSLAKAVKEEIERLRRIREGSSSDPSDCSCYRCRIESGKAASTSDKGSPKKHRKSAKERTVLDVVRHSEEAKVNGLFCFGRPFTPDWEENLLSSVDCFSASASAYELLARKGDSSLGFEHWQSATRCHGWACNELGRRRVAKGDTEAAEHVFMGALASFRAVNDTPNLVLVYLNLGHARRSLAEQVASEMTQKRLQNGQKATQNIGLQACVAQAMQLYGQSLEEYLSGRRELVAIGESTAQKTLGGLWSEVHTQLGHTYLRLGMLLAQTDHSLVNLESSLAGLDIAGVVGLKATRKKMSEKELEALPKEAMTKALALYESLGETRLQEAAYAHWQLAGFFRDRCLLLRSVESARGKGKGAENKGEMIRRYATLAEVHWTKAQEVYSAKEYPDMFVRIATERAELTAELAPVTHPNQALEAALSHLFHVKQACLMDKEGSPCWPPTISEGVRSSFRCWLLKVLKQLVVNASQKPDNHVQSADSLSKVRLQKLRTLYKEALNMGEDIDLEKLSRLWTMA